VSDDKRAGEIISGLRLLLTKGEMQCKPLDLNHVVSDVLRLVRSDLLNTGVIVNTELMRGLPMANGDRVQLQQVLINLVVNGCEAMAKVESPARQLVVRTALTVEGEVCTSVSDMGHGVPSHNLERVFDPFFTTKKHGLGLGLAVCRTIIAAQGGRLWAANNTGRGASFHFTLPAVPRTL
jgi:C4-dicarboxylate-specific signal transduction histidine kinase